MSVAIDNAISEMNSLMFSLGKFSFFVGSHFLFEPLELTAIFTFFLGGCGGGGAQRRQDVSTVSDGLLYSDDLRCSSTSFGVTQITCCPFQYLTKFNDCRVLIISA